MGSLSIPAESLVYLDASIIVYSVEKHPVYFPLLVPMWAQLQANKISIVTSELSVMESYIGPLKKSDSELLNDYRSFFDQQEISLIPIKRDILEVAARYRAALSTLRTPDAIHVATAVFAQASMFLSNDKTLRQLTTTPVVILQDYA